MKIELDRGQIVDIRYALSLAAVDAIDNDCPISAKIFEELRKYIVQQFEQGEIARDKENCNRMFVQDKPEKRLYCKNCVHCESNSDGTRCLLKNRCVSLNAHAEECSNYTEIQKP